MHPEATRVLERNDNLELPDKTQLTSTGTVYFIVITILQVNGRNTTNAGACIKAQFKTSELPLKVAFDLETSPDLSSASDKNMSLYWLLLPELDVAP